MIACSVVAGAVLRPPDAAPWIIEIANWAPGLMGLGFTVPLSARPHVSPSFLVHRSSEHYLYLRFPY